MLNVLENLQKFSELYLYDALNLLSCMTLNGKNIQFIFLHYKYKLFTVLNCPRNFGNAVKDGLKRTSHWGGCTTLQIQILGILYLNVPWFCRSCQQFNRYHLCRWHHRAYRRWGTGRKHLLRQCVSALSVRKQRARAGPSPLYLFQRGNGQPHSDFEEIIQKDDGILEYDSPSDDGDISSLERNKRWRQSHSFITTEIKKT